MYKKIILAALIVILPVQAETFPEFIDAVKREAKEKGFNPQIVTDAFGGKVEPVVRAIQKKNNQPEVKFSHQKYVTSLLSSTRIQKGKAKLKTAAQPLAAAEEAYGVPAKIITALWGIESNYGSHKGKFNIIPSVATLAYNSHRKPFFRKQLFAAIQMVDEGHIKLEDFNGSWAGAAGQVQFIPTSFLAFAVDGDGDGKKDLWHTDADIIASAANYLKKNGWVRGQPVYQRVLLTKFLPADMNFDKRGLSDRKNLSEWQKLGIKHLNNQPFPKLNGYRPRLYLPEGPSKYAYLVYQNFDTILRWNNSSVFAFTVARLSEEITK